MARKRRKINEAIPGGGIWHRFGFPDDGTGISTDDDRPPGNILIGVKYKPIDYFNRLTSFNRNWDMDTGEWLWNHFENAGGQDDFENYSETLKGLEKLLPKETWKEVWRRMRHVPDAEVSADFDASGQPHRGADTQLGKDKEEYIDDPPKEIQSEDLITRIDRLTL